jgi:hypothetical protein
MSTAEIALNTPRAVTPVDATSHRGLEGLPKEVELNVPNDFNRRFNDDFGYYWVYKPRRKSDLTARIYLDEPNLIIRFAVFDESRNKPEGGERIEMWSAALPIAAGWKKQVAETCGAIMKQADKHPKCRRCGKFMVIRRRGSDRVQFLGCAGFPGCSGSASIGAYEVEFPDSNGSSHSAP